MFECLEETAGCAVGHGDPGVNRQEALAGSRIGDDAGGEVEVDLLRRTDDDRLVGVLGAELFVFDDDLSGSRFGFHG